MVNIRRDFIDINKFSRPGPGPDEWGYKWKGAQGIVFHWGYSARATAQNYRDAHAKKTKYGGYPYFIDWEEIVQVGEDNELYYHVGSNYYTDVGKRFGSYPCEHLIGICLAHKEWKGQFHPYTLYQAALLAATLCFKYDLDPMHTTFRHTDITAKGLEVPGKKELGGNELPCPKWLWDHGDEWLEFQDAIKAEVIRLKQWEEIHVSR